MKDDNYLKIALAITSIIISVSLFNDQKISKSKAVTELELNNKGAESIKELIDEGKLSAKEALFYEKVK